MCSIIGTVLVSPLGGAVWPHQTQCGASCSLMSSFSGLQNIWWPLYSSDLDINTLCVCPLFHSASEIIVSTLFCATSMKRCRCPCKIWAWFFFNCPGNVAMWSMSCMETRYHLFIPKTDSWTYQMLFNQQSDSSVIKHSVLICCPIASLKFFEKQRQKISENILLSSLDNWKKAVHSKSRNKRVSLFRH